MTQAKIDRLESQAFIYDQILKDIKTNGEEYPGERKRFEGKLIAVNTQLHQISDEYLPF